MNAEVQLSFEKLNNYISAYFQNNDESSLLCDAKEYFSSFINSTRKLERIQNIEDLLKLLKRNGLFNAYYRNSFRVFSKIIIDNNFDELVQGHNALLNTLPNVDQPLKNIYGKF